MSAQSQMEIVKERRQDGESAREFARRLNGMGARETACLKALVRQFSLPIEDARSVASEFEDMRIRDVQADVARHLNRGYESRSIWVMRNFQVDRAEAEPLIARALA